MIARATWYVSEGPGEKVVSTEIEIPLGVSVSFGDCDKYVMDQLRKSGGFHPTYDDVVVEYISHRSTIKIVR